MSQYGLPIGPHRLALGDAITVGSPAVASRSADTWSLAPGSYTPRTLAFALRELLDAVVVQLGPTADRQVLIDGLAATLGGRGAEATLPVEVFDFADTARKEIAGQTRAIGAQLLAWAAEPAPWPDTTSHLAELAIRSPCEGYQWTKGVIGQLLGPAGNSAIMQIYNEWLHQIVLLRDGVLPFENWQDVTFELAGDGTRRVAPERERFVGKFFTQRLSHAAIVDLARALFASTPAPPATYGFQATTGLAIPALFGDHATRALRYLLTWHPARLADTKPGSVVDFVAKEADYFAASRAAFPSDATSTSTIADPRFVVGGGASDARTLGLEMSASDGGAPIDLGQIARGHRFSYRAGETAGNSAQASATLHRHNAQAVLAREGLVAASSGTHVVATGGDPLLELALLGRLLPENIVLRHQEPWDVVLASGRGNGATVVLDSEAATVR